MSKFSYKNLPPKEQLKIDLIGYALALILYCLPYVGVDLGGSDRFLRIAVFLGPFYIAFQCYRVLRQK